jgi:hypothetical protein
VEDIRSEEIGSWVGERRGVVRVRRGERGEGVKGGEFFGWGELVGDSFEDLSELAR